MVIPYRFSGVRYGEPKREVWEDHLRFLKQLDNHLEPALSQSIVIGDFNQRVPRMYQSQNVFNRLQEVILDHYHLATGGIIEPIGEQAIDHICYSQDLTLYRVRGLTNDLPNGRRISDHFGLMAELHKSNF